MGKSNCLQKYTKVTLPQKYTIWTLKFQVKEFFYFPLLSIVWPPYFFFVLFLISKSTVLQVTQITQLRMFCWPPSRNSQTFHDLDQNATFPKLSQPKKRYLCLPKLWKTAWTLMTTPTHTSHTHSWHIHTHMHHSYTHMAHSHSTLTHIWHTHTWLTCTWHTHTQWHTHTAHSYTHTHRMLTHTLAPRNTHSTSEQSKKVHVHMSYFSSPTLRAGQHEGRVATESTVCRAGPQKLSPFNQPAHNEYYSHPPLKSPPPPPPSICDIHISFWNSPHLQSVICLQYLWSGVKGFASH